MKIELTLYADVLFLIDFSMDFVSLYITGRMTHARAKARRMTLAAALGALCSVLLTCFEAGRAFSVLSGVLCSAFMCFAAFGAEKPVDFIRRCAVLWCAGFLLGGTMTAALSMGSYGNISYRDGAASQGHMILILPVALVVSGLFFVLGHVSARRAVDVTITFNGKTTHLRGLADSGNLLTDPFSGDMVVIISKSCVGRVFGEYEINLTEDVSGELIASRMRLIPATGIGGESLLKAVRADSVYINGKERRALIGISDTSSDFAGSFECLVPSKLI